MPVLKVFKSSIPSVNFVTSRGSTLVFKDGRYLTDNLKEIAELEDEIKSRHPHIYIDPAEKEVDTTILEEIEAAKRKAEADVLAKHGKAAETNVGAGQTMSPAKLLGVTSSAALSGLAGASNSAGKVG